MRHLNDSEQAFLEYLCWQYPIPESDLHREAKVMFSAIQAAFTKNHTQLADEEVSIPWELAAYLAACANTALEYDVAAGMPWDRGDHDHIALRLFQTFVSTIVRSFRSGSITRDKETVKVEGDVDYVDRVSFGCLTLPDWFETAFVFQES